MTGFAVTTVDELPVIEPDEGVDWRPVQHYFGLTAFGINVYRAAEPGAPLVGEHDEREGDHEEVYLVLEGSVDFTIGGETHRLERGALVTVWDPAVVRSGVAATAGAAVLAVGARRRERFESTWRPDHFRGVPTHPR